jgi:tellurite resistance protein
MTQEELKWSYNEFLTFVMIYASHVDMEFSDEEMSNIRSRVDQEAFDKMYAEFDKRNDFETLQTILGYKDLYFPNDESKNEILKTIKLQFFADGEYSPMERELMHFFEKLM